MSIFHLQLVAEHRYDYVDDEPAKLLHTKNGIAIAKKDIETEKKIQKTKKKKKNK